MDFGHATPTNPELLHSRLLQETQSGTKSATPVAVHVGISCAVGVAPGKP